MFRKFYVSNRLPNRYFPKIAVGCPCSLSYMEPHREESFLEVAMEVTILLISCCGTILGNVVVLAAVVMKEKLNSHSNLLLLP